MAEVVSQETESSSTSSVAAIANTPSLKVSKRAVPGSSTARIVADAADGQASAGASSRPISRTGSRSVWRRC